MKGFKVQGSMFKVKEGARREATGESRKIVPMVPAVRQAYHERNFKCYAPFKTFQVKPKGSPISRQVARAGATITI
jgi:hypothetical protein